MFKKILSSCVIVSLSLCSIPSFADFFPSYNNSLVPFEYNFKPNSYREFENPLPFPATARCTVSTQDSLAPILVKVIRKSGTVNGKRLSSGEQLIIEVHDGEQFKVMAEGFAKVSLMNKATHVIHAKCEV